MKKQFSLVAILCLVLVSFSACKAHKEYERELEDLYAQIDSLKNLSNAVDTVFLQGDTVYVISQGDTTISIGVEQKDGAILAPFSVADGKQVYFSMGNLQYQASSSTWRFAEHQYDIIGNDNSNISATYDGWIDLFGWGTSNYHNALDTFNTNYYPYSTNNSVVNSTYNYFGYGPSINMADPNLIGTSANYDWGVYNAISNGGNTVGLWRTLTKDEWVYLLETRTNAQNLYFRAKVNNTNGLILLPDDWNRMAWYALTNINYTLSVNNFNTNVYSVTDWQLFEAWGAIFLPSSGYRGQTTIYSSERGSYWSSTYDNASGAYAVSILYTKISIEYFNRDRGRSVRLVQDVQ